MKKITNRALSVLLIACLVICGLVVYVLRYVDDGRSWALYFSAANSGSTGQILDRSGSTLVTLHSGITDYAEDELTRRACYHITGDYWGRTGTGMLSALMDSTNDFNLLTGTTQAEDTDLCLSVDAGLCRRAYEAIGAENKGAAMVMDYTTGELLCLVSLPAIDPMNPEEEPGEGAYINRCISASFIPGSVFKLITTAAAIENIPDIYERSFYCEGVYTIAGIDITCSGTHYTQTFEQALSNSCNCAFARIAVMLGQDTMMEYVRKYGFLDSHRIDGIDTASGSYPLDFVGDPELAWSGIGQSTDLVCPFSLLRFVAAIANGGSLAEPHLVASGTSPAQAQLVDKDTADALARMMDYNVVSHYDAENNFPGLDICAKTGTAELGDGSSHAWFTGFLDDAEHPYAFVVLIEQGGGGLSVAGKAANEILQYAVNNLS